MLTGLRLSNASLNEVPNLSNLHLRTVDLEGNRLHNLDNLPMTLVELNVSYNRLIQDGFLLPFPSLQILNASHNHINIYDEDEFVICFPSLKTLNLSSNCLKSTSFLRDTVVEHANLSQNRMTIVTNLPPTLKVLIADTNHISMIQSKLPASLETIHLAYNCLRYAGVPLTWPSALRELYLNHNEIDKFPRRLPDGLEVLNLSYNKLKELPDRLPHSLRVAVFSSNRIQKLPPYKKRIPVFLIDNNCLTCTPSGDIATVFSADDNWDTPDHHESQTIIRNCWKRYVLTLRLRHFKRTLLVREELFTVSMMPERWQQIDVLDSVWFSGSVHSRIDHH